MYVFLFFFAIYFRAFSVHEISRGRVWHALRIVESMSEVRNVILPRSGAECFGDEDFFQVPSEKRKRNQRKKNSFFFGANGKF